MLSGHRPSRTQPSRHSTDVMAVRHRPRMNASAANSAIVTKNGVEVSTDSSGLMMTVVTHWVMAVVIG